MSEYFDIRDARARIAELEAEFSAEHKRRLKAEEVVDYAISCISRAASRKAVEYRTQYPRVGEEK